jgi:membrane protein implicated in regulation of membrane protease activity
MVIAWLVLGVVLLLAELRHFGFFALFGSLGAFAAAVVAAAWPEAIPVQVAVAVVVAVVGILAFRPMMSEAFHRRYQEGRLGRGVHGTLVGEEVLTLDAVGDENHVGHVRLAGERWLATSGGGTEIPAGTAVVVTGVQGTTLIVWPVDGRFIPELPQSADDSADRPEGEPP